MFKTWLCFFSTCFFAFVIHPCRTRQFTTYILGLFDVLLHGSKLYCLYVCTYLLTSLTYRQPYVVLNSGAHSRDEGSLPTLKSWFLKFSRERRHANSAVECSMCSFIKEISINNPAVIWFYWCLYLSKTVRLWQSQARCSFYLTFNF